MQFIDFITWPKIQLALVAVMVILTVIVDAKVCASINVRNSPSRLEQLRNCTVVEGNVQIVLIERANESDFEPWSFPELREITQYLLLNRVRGLRKVGQLFPNLVKIGGANLFIDYGLVIHEMFSLQEIGLSSLKEVSRGSVIVTKNPILCYVNTINWDLIARWDPLKNYVANNKNPRDCPRCLANCSQGLCWSRSECQIQPNQPECHHLCVGGCSGPGPRACHSCRRVLTADNECVQSCPEGMYEYLNRRCITKEECTAIDLPNATSGGLLQAANELKKYIVFNGTCTDSCPPGFDLDKTGTGCEPCLGKCQRWCTGMCIENIGDAQAFRGCTHIRGPLEISIKSGKPKVVAQELEENLGSIEEIESNLKIVRSFPIANLNFLKNLTVIHGKNVDTGFGDNYTFLVLENQNLQELWDWNRKRNLKILKGKVFFHYNPKLCLQHIYKLLSVIHHDTNVSNLEVGKDSNGDKFPCNATDIKINVTSKSSSLIQMKIPYLKINYDTAVLWYVIYFIKDKYSNITMFDEFDQCSDYSWRTKDVSIDRHDQYFLNNGVLVNLTDLEPNTQYAFYVTMYTLDRFGAKSKIYFETTLPTRPSELARIEAMSNKSSEIYVHWEPPKYPNGKLKEYIVTWSPLQYDVTPIRQRNYCESQITYTIETDTFKSDVPVKEETGKSCCPNSKKSLHKPKDGFEQLCSTFVRCQLLSKASDKDISMSCESCFYSYVYDHPISPIDNHIKSQIPNKTGAGKESWKKHSLNRERSIAITQIVPGNTSEFVVSNLLHFKEYLITVRACREIHPEEQDKSNENRCSKTEMIVVRTQKDNQADTIPNAINYEVVNGTVSISWDTPRNPNGLVVAFQVEHQHLDGSNHVINCLPFSEYVHNNGRFSILGLAPGGYEVRVRAISLAGKGPFTDYVYFKISNGKLSVYDILFFVIFLCIIIIFISIGASVYKKQRRLDILVANVNPDYHYIQDHWEIPREDIELVSELGAGSFGKVYEGIIKSSNTSCAVKTVSDDATEYETFVFLSEAAVMKSVAGAYHIVRLLGVVSTVRPPLVIMELMSLGDLKTYLRSTRETPPSNATIISMALQIGDGMTFMETKKYVHRDLAARNCMLNKDCVVKVGDFGMARDIYETDYYRKNSTGLLPIRWMAPESLKDGVFTSHSDVWSFGVVLWEIVTLAEQPYQGSSNDQVLEEVIGGRRLEIPRDCAEALKSIMASCWKRKPLQRMTFMQIVTSLEYYHDEFFKKVSYYHSQEAMDMRKSSSDYMEMKSVEDPLLGNADASTDPSKMRSVSLLLSKVKSFAGERLSRIEEAGPSTNDQI